MKVVKHLLSFCTSKTTQLHAITLKTFFKIPHQQQEYKAVKQKDSTIEIMY